MEHRPRFALLWLLVAQVIDGIDGPLARKFKVREHLPTIDGRILDLVIDYMTCVVVPVLFALRFHVWPAHGELIVASLVLTTSVLWFSRTDIETNDIWFRGFPTAWNLVIIFFWILGTSPHTNLIISLLFVALTLTPQIKFFHMLSSPQLRKVTIPFTVLAMIEMAWLARMGHHSRHPVARFIVIAWVAYALGMTIWRSLQPDEIYKHPL